MKMNDNEWKTPEEMKKLIGSHSKEGDYRTLNEAVKLGNIEVKQVTLRKKVYRWKTKDNQANNDNIIDLDFNEAA